MCKHAMRPLPENRQVYGIIEFLSSEECKGFLEWKLYPFSSVMLYSLFLCHVGLAIAFIEGQSPAVLGVSFAS